MGQQKNNDASGIYAGAENVDMIDKKAREEPAMFDQKKPAPIPYNAFEAIVSTHERHIKRLLIALTITIALLATTNIAWLYAWMQYDYIGTEEQTEIDVAQEGRGLNIYGNGNEVHNGADDPYQENDPNADTD